jgi:signal recognition particle receptor subunit alpha
LTGSYHALSLSLLPELQVHARCLDVELYQEGYEKDAALVAKAAIKKATEEEYDVVLVDTAGRMQSNGPLMAALAKLIDINSPDLVLFVGEALAGNDAIDQVQQHPFRRLFK